MIFRHEQGGAVWIDVEQPTPEEIHQVAQEFRVSERLEAELIGPSPFPLVAAESDMVLLVLHFPVHSENDHHGQEVDFLVGQHFVITIRYEVVAPLHQLRKLLETESVTLGQPSLTSTDVLLEVLFAHLYASVREHINHTASRLAHAEKEMFDGNEARTVRAVSDVSREFLHLESGLANQEEPLTRFLKALGRRGFFGAAFTERGERILAERAQVARLIETHGAIATELRETNAVLLEARQNGIMKTLTIITFIMLPLELIVGLFDLHVPGVPLQQTPNSFWFIIGAMAIIAAALTFVFARKRWL